MIKLLLINGPNLNLLGSRQPHIYGSETLANIEQQLADIVAGYKASLLCYQSNHEGQLIDFIQQHADAQGIIINPGGLTHSSFSLLDALLSVDVPFVEVHISNIYSRELARQKSLFSAFAKGVIAGCQAHGYCLAVNYLLHYLQVPGK